MKNPPKPKQPGKIKVEPGFEKRLGDMYKKVLHTPPPRKQGEPPKRPAPRAKK
jgi:hypothetical protein